MTSILATAQEPQVAQPVTVALLGASVPPAAGLGEALSAFPTAEIERHRGPLTSNGAR